MAQKTDLLIVGAGPVGLFANFQAGMLGMSSITVDALPEIGGQCSALYPEKPIYDIPAYPVVFAQDLINNLLGQAKKFNPTFLLNQQVISVEKIGDIFISKTSAGNVIESKVILICAGSGAFGPNRPPIHNTESYENHSVFYKVNDKSIFTDKNIAIAGGGDSAIDWTIELSNIASKIYLIHRREKFKASENSMQEVRKLVDLGKVEMIIPYQLSNIVGDSKRISELLVEDLDGNVKSLQISHLLAFFGLHADVSAMSSWGLNFMMHHIVVNPQTLETNIPGIYAAGDIVSYPQKLKLILCGFSEVAMALHHAYNKVFNKALHFEYSTSNNKFKN